MRKLAVTAAAFALLMGTQFAMTTSALAAPAPTADVEMEMMTWPELKAAIEKGKNTALIYTGGTEQRGPQNVIGGHQFMGKPLVIDIARKLGNAIVFPVMPFTPTGTSKEVPGGIPMPADVLGVVLEHLGEAAVSNGFTNVVLMGDSGGGQGPTGVYATVAKKLDDKYKAQGIRVIYADEVYTKANSEFLKQIVSEGYPMSTHGGIPDTSLMLLVEKPGEELVRKDLLATAIGDPVLPPGTKPDPNVKRINNGISGDGRRSSKELGKRLYDMKLNMAVTQIQSMLKK